MYRFYVIVHAFIGFMVWGCKVYNTNKMQALYAIIMYYFWCVIEMIYML